MGIKEKYQELSKKHKLPSFEEIDSEFEISTIEKDQFLLREVRRKITEKLEIYAKFLEDTLSPEASTSNLYESKIFSEEERTRLFELYKKLMFFDRFSIETSIGENDEKTSEYIVSVLKEWNLIKEQFKELISKAKENWLKDVDVEEELGYLG